VNVLLTLDGVGLAGGIGFFLFKKNEADGTSVEAEIGVVAAKSENA